VGHDEDDDGDDLRLSSNMKQAIEEAELQNEANTLLIKANTSKVKIILCFSFFSV